MGSTLSPEECQQYERNGFAFPFTVLEPTEVAMYKQAFDQLEPRLVATGARAHGQCHLHFRWAYELVTHPSILDVIEKLIGPDILVHSTTIFAKQPRKPGFVSWHQDAYHWHLDEPRLVSAWVALTPSTSENGCLRVVPGSHKRRLPHAIIQRPDNMLKSAGLHVELEINEAEVVDFVLQPGQMSLHHANVVHGSNPNNSDGWRIGFAIRYVASDVRQSTPHHEVVLARGRDIYGHYKRIEQPPSTDIDSGVAAHAAFWAKFDATQRAQVM
jgi:ectoine hydroxylase-related dioxygenase (phytanoyl-CoA dioxygenase family)